MAKKIVDKPRPLIPRKTFSLTLKTTTLLEFRLRSCTFARLRCCTFPGSDITLRTGAILRGEAHWFFGGVHGYRAG
jgi:hypothetical protein